MVMDDTESKRKIFFYSFSIVTVIQFLVMIVIAFGELDKADVFEKECKNLKSEGKLD